MKFVKFTIAKKKIPILINLDDVQSICQDGEYSVLAFRGEDACITLEENISEVSKRIQEAQNDRR